MWQQVEGNPMDSAFSVWSAERSAQGWSVATKISEEPTTSGVALAMSEQRDAVLAYQIKKAVDLPTELRVKRFSAAGGWGETEIPLGGSPVGRPSVGVFPDGHAVVVWNVYSARGDLSMDVWAIQTSGTGWSEPVRLAEGAKNIGSPSFALTVGQSIAMVAWQDNTTQQIQMTQLD